MGAIKNKHTIKQTDKLLMLFHMRRYVTSADAWSIGITSLHRRLSDLKERGYIFGSEFVTNDNGVRFKRYWIVSEPAIKKETTA